MEAPYQYFFKPFISIFPSNLLKYTVKQFKMEIIQKINSKLVIRRPGPRFEPESRDPQSRRITTYPTPAHNDLYNYWVECRGRDSNPGRPTPTGPKPVPFGQLGHPCFTLHYPIIYGVIYLLKCKNAPSGIRTRVFGSKGRNDWPDYTNGATD